MARPRKRTVHELRCFCSRETLLALYGIDEKGQLYIHQKVYKQNRVFGESLFYGGTVCLLCRECLRWQKIVMRTPTTPVLEPVEVPEVLRHEVDDRSTLPTDQPRR